MRRLLSCAAALLCAGAMLQACSVQEGNAGAANGGGLSQDAGAGGGTQDAGAGTPHEDAGAAVGGQDAAPSNDQGATGKPCSADGTCTSGICYRGACAAACTKPSECAAGENCASDNGKRTFCVKPAYDPLLGTSCAGTGTCKNNLKCSGAKEVASATCTGQCKDDTDCPMDMDCSAVVGGASYCAKRSFCTGCQHDGNCGKDGVCVEQSTGRFCTKLCTAGSTECPRFATCKESVDGRVACLHQSGSCTAFGKQCDPCKVDANCEGDATCLSFIFSKESFCSDVCTDTCGGGGKCVETSQTAKVCIPNYTAPAMPTCVDKLAPTMEIGDIMDDFAMVGLTDMDGDGDMLDEQMRVFRFSDFEDNHKIILFNISAGWCSACQAETHEFTQLTAQFGHKGLVIFQVLYDGHNSKQWTFPSQQVLEAWIKNLKPAGVIGVDPERNCVPYNTKNSTPVNMIIDAKTRKVLNKWNGYGKGKAAYEINSWLSKL